MKKRYRMLILLALVLLAGGIWFCSHPERPVIVRGKASAHEVKEIKKAVKNAMRSEVFPSASWDNLKALPKRFRLYLKQDVRTITVLSANHAAVTTESPPDANRFLTQRNYAVDKGTNGWKAHSVPLIYDIF